MSKWTPLIVTGDYPARQAKANAAGAICYYEQHMNAYSLAAPEYGLVQVAHNASATSKAWATELAVLWQALTGRPTRLRQTALGGRGNSNISKTAMPAILGEPGPISHGAFDDWMDVVSNRSALAAAVAASIMERFPRGGVVALSVGHLGKTSAPRDTGAGDADAPGDPNDQTEGQLNQDIIERVAFYLNLGSATGAPQTPPAPIPNNPPAPKPTPVPVNPAWPGINFRARMNKRGAFLDAIVYGEALKPWQRRMAERGWNIGADDGVFGEKCYKVAGDFQKEKKLGYDHIVGRNTWAAAWTAPVT